MNQRIMCAVRHTGREGGVELSKFDFPFILVEVVTHVCPKWKFTKPAVLLNVCCTTRSCHVKCERCLDDDKEKKKIFVGGFLLCAP